MSKRVTERIKKREAELNGATKTPAAPAVVQDEPVKPVSKPKASKKK